MYIINTGMTLPHMIPYLVLFMLADVSTMIIFQPGPVDFLIAKQNAKEPFLTEQRKFTVFSFFNYLFLSSNITL